MYYLIRNLIPQKSMGGFGFCIDLHPDIRKFTHVLTQAKVDLKVERCAREWLDIAGYDEWWDLDDPGFHEWGVKEKVRTANCRPLWDHRSIRVQWSEWGCNNISVPGNACGLDIVNDYSLGCLFKDGTSLVPHNVDNWPQVQLLLMVFTSFMEDIVCISKCGGWDD